MQVEKDPNLIYLNNIRVLLKWTIENVVRIVIEDWQAGRGPCQFSAYFGNNRLGTNIAKEVAVAFTRSAMGIWEWQK